MSNYTTTIARSAMPYFHTPTSALADAAAGDPVGVAAELRYRTKPGAQALAEKLGCTAGDLANARPTKAKSKGKPAKVAAAPKAPKAPKAKRVAAFKIPEMVQVRADAMGFVQAKIRADMAVSAERKRIPGLAGEALLNLWLAIMQEAGYKPALTAATATK